MPSKPSLRILHVTFDLQGGGAEQQLLYFLSSRCSSEMTQAVCCGTDEGRERVPSTVPIYTVPKRTRLDMRWRRIRAVLRDFKPDLIHCWLPSLLWSCLPPALSCGIPVLASYRLANRVSNVAELAHLLPLFFVRRLTANVATLYQPYRWIYGLKKGVYIPNAIDPTAARSAQPIHGESWCREGEFRLLYAGRLDAQKRPDLVLQALAGLTADNCKLILCGSGPLETQTKEMVAQLGLQERVHFLGYRTDLARVMKSCHALVQASDNEGMPNTVFEAMACRLPVIVSSIPQHTQWIINGMHGAVFTAGDADSLRDCMAAAQTCDGTTKERQLDQAATLLEDLTVERMVRRYQDVYRDCLSC